MDNQPSAIASPSHVAHLAPHRSSSTSHPPPQSKILGQNGVQEKSIEYLERERKVVRKVDWILMPILTVTFGLQYYDKAVLGNAAVYGVLKDLDLTETINGVTYTTRYSTATAAFYYGYIVAVLPFALLFARLPLAKTCAIVVLIWGITCLLTVVCHDYPGFVAQRVALGLMESAVSPAFVAVTGLWYKPYEQAKRLGIWYSATGIFSMISGIINYGLGHTTLPSPWKALYYFCGSLTIAWSFVILLFMPTSPTDPGRWFSEAEKEVLVNRFMENPWGMDRQRFKWEQFVEGVGDWKTWVYFSMATAIYICNGAVTAFGARIISSFGYSPLQTTALLIPGGFVTCITIYFFSYFADKYHNIRTYLLPLSCIPVVVGAITIWTAPWQPTAGPLIGYYLVASFGAPYVLLLSLASANVLGASKKAVTSGAIFIGYNVGNIVAAYLVFAQEVTIKYRSTWIAVIVGMVYASAASLFLRWMYTRENSQREQQMVSVSTNIHNPTAAPEGKPAGEKDIGAGEGVGHAGVVNDDFGYEDLTAKHRPEFRYTL